MRYILSLDQGTTSSRAILFDADGKVISVAQEEFTQHFPQPGWVEHDPEDIWQSQLRTARKVIAQSGITADQLAGTGITNQRETTVAWDAETGKPLCNAIVWQDRRTAQLCEDLKRQGREAEIRFKTGLVADAYFSGTKMKWMLDHVAAVKNAADAKRLKFGNVDSWLIWNLTKGEVHATDVSNASRTMLFNIRTGEWDADLLAALGIPQECLPEVRESAGHFGYTDASLLGLPSSGRIPILSAIGDQQSALFGQSCFQPGMAKNTYGTGCFLLMNTGHQPVPSSSGLLTTIAWKLNGEMQYALEGSVFIAGAAIQWLRDGIGIISHASETESLANSVADTGGVYFVPAFTGLGAPWWDMYARGAIFGLTRGTTKAHIVRAALESICYQTRDVLDAMRKDSGLDLHTLRVDGGATANDFLMQFQSDILGTEVERPAFREYTAWGAAALAGISAGMWDLQRLASLQSERSTFTPGMDSSRREFRYARWKDAVERSRGWERSI